MKMLLLMRTKLQETHQADPYQIFYCSFSQRTNTIIKLNTQTRIGVLPIGCGFLCLSLFCCALLCVLSSFAIILRRERELVALLLLSYGCLVTVNILCLFLAVPWVGLRCVLVVFPDHTHLLYENRLLFSLNDNACSQFCVCSLYYYIILCPF